MGTVPADVSPASLKAGRSHLLRHTLPEIDIAEHFGTTDGKEIAKDIARMGQKELQARRARLAEAFPVTGDGM